MQWQHDSTDTVGQPDTLLAIGAVDRREPVGAESTQATGVAADGGVFVAGSQRCLYHSSLGDYAADALCQWERLGL